MRHELTRRAKRDKERTNEPSPYTPPLPFTQILSNEKQENHFQRFVEILNKMYVNLPLTEVITQLPYSKFLKDIVSNRRVISEHASLVLNTDVISIVQHEMPKKVKDHGSFSIPIKIGDIHVDKALCDLGASVSLIPYSLCQRLDIGNLVPTQVSLRLADRTLRRPKGVLEDVPIKIGNYFIPVDFFVLEMDVDHEIPIILGRPFLNTVEATIRCGEDSIELNLGKEKIKYYLKDIMQAPCHEMTCNMLGITFEWEELTPYEHDVLDNDSTNFSFESLLSFDDLDDNELKCELETNNEEENGLNIDLYAHMEVEAKIDPLPQDEKPSNGKEFDGKVEMRPLPSNLKYEFLGPNSTFPVIVGNCSDDLQTSKLLDVLRTHRRAIGYTIDDLRGINPQFCMHHIRLDESARPSRETQRRLNPKLGEVVLMK